MSDSAPPADMPVITEDGGVCWDDHFDDEDEDERGVHLHVPCEGEAS